MADPQYGERLDTDRLTATLERAGWSGPSSAVPGAAESATTGYGQHVSPEALADALEFLRRFHGPAHGPSIAASTPSC